MTKIYSAPMASMHMELQLVFALDDDVDDSDKKIMRSKMDQTKINFSDTMATWLNNCVGHYRVYPKTWDIEFELEEDYVRYCLEWL